MSESRPAFFDNDSLVPIISTEQTNKTKGSQVLNLKATQRYQYNLSVEHVFQTYVTRPI